MAKTFVTFMVLGAHGILIYLYNIYIYIYIYMSLFVWFAIHQLYGLKMIAVFLFFGEGGHTSKPHQAFDGTVKCSTSWCILYMSIW